MIKKLLPLFAAVLLSGCASHYFFNGKKYDNEETFQAAVESDRQAALNSIQPLPAPLTKKRLIFAIPSEQTLYAENARRHQTATGRELTGIGVDQNRNLSKATFIMHKVYFEGIQKRRIYLSVEFRETNTAVNSLEPSADYDVMYFTEPAVGTGQYFYASAKHGKQVFAYDRSESSVAGRVNNFISAVQALAVRD